MNTLRCFWLEPTDRERRYLRRYVHSDPGRCAVAPTGYHDAMGEIEPGLFNQGDRCPPRGDSRWPARCGCGYSFRPEDCWQLFTRHIYLRTDTGEETTLHDAPPGAMWNADWISHWRGPDGMCLVVKTPGGDWMVDGPSCHPNGDRHNERGWTRSGQVPHVTAHPSILIPGRYHGWLRDGCLVDC